MPSPFPGMDPWLERPHSWRDVHLTMLLYLKNALRRALPPGYSVAADTVVLLDDELFDESDGVRVPDVSVATTLTESSKPRRALAAPVVATVPAPELAEHNFLKVTTDEGERVVAALELLSPSNKVKSRRQYLERREQYLSSDTHLVEIDLLRVGRRMPLEGAVPASDYLVMVSDERERPQVGAWPFSLRDPLPRVPVPLLGDEAAVLDLPGAFAAAYDEGGLGVNARYRRPPEPPLSDADAAWARGVLFSAGVLPEG